MVVSLCVAFEYPFCMHSFNVFEVGNNKEYFNQGKSNFLMQEDVLPKMNAAITTMSKLTSNGTPINLYVSGQVLTFLQEEAPETLDSLTALVKEDNISLMAGPFHESSLQVINNTELAHQIKHHNQIYKEIFSKKADIIFSSEGSIQSNMTQTILECGFTASMITNGVKTGVFEAETGMLSGSIPTIYASTEINSEIDSKNISKNAVVFLDKDAFSDLDLLDKLNAIDANNTFTAFSNIAIQTDSSMIFSTKTSELGNHIQNELKEFYPHLANLGGDMIQSWRNLSNKAALIPLTKSGIESTSTEKSSYEHYIGMMNILNDITFRAESGINASKGLDVGSPVVVNEPHKRLMAIMNKN